MIPVISIVANASNLGKTTILCKIIKELKDRDYKVATIKHHHKDNIEIDKPGKDSWKHAESGTDIVVVSSPTKIAKIEKTEKEYTLDEITRTIENVDIIITEGYKKENKSKIEILRKGLSEEIISNRDELLVVIADFKIKDNIPQFNFEETKEIVDFIEERFLINNK